MSEKKVEYCVEISLTDYLQAAKKEVNLQSFKLEYKGIKAEIVVMNQRTFDNLSRALQNEALCYQDDLMVNKIFCGLHVALLAHDIPNVEAFFSDMFLRVC